jgi:signal transduction histidine kinase
MACPARGPSCRSSSCDAGRRDRALLFALFLTPLALAGAGAGLYAVGIQSKWLFAAVAGLASLAVVLSLWLYAVSDERRRLQYETLAERQANRLKSEFLNHLTHELRTPLTAIMGFNKLNQFTDDLGRESRIHNSAIIGRNCEHLALINNNSTWRRSRPASWRSRRHRRTRSS